jgi:biofilm PGA synthesis N-glycosyltransferase PgaC
LSERKGAIGVFCYNEGENLTRLLDNLLCEQDLAQNTEIFVVCSGCMDNSPKFVRELSERERRVRPLYEVTRNGKASAVNEVLKRYSGEYLFLIPADVVPAKNALSRLLRELSNPKVGVVCGHPTPVIDTGKFAGYLCSLIWRLHNRALREFTEANMNTHASGEFMLVRRGVVRRLPLDVVNDDSYIGVVAANKGLIVKYCDEAKVYIRGPTTLADYIRQRRRVVYGHHQVKRLTGCYSTTMTAVAFHNPRRIVRVFCEEIGERPSHFLELCLSLVVEGMVNLLAFLDVLLRRHLIAWDRVTSAKGLITNEDILKASEWGRGGYGN